MLDYLSLRSLLSVHGTSSRKIFLTSAMVASCSAGVTFKPDDGLLPAFKRNSKIREMIEIDCETAVSSSKILKQNLPKGVRVGGVYDSSSRSTRGFLLEGRPNEVGDYSFRVEVGCAGSRRKDEKTYNFSVQP
ncbi:MAG: hypothetical protein NT027_14350 [Proteobacteria bacterium]|nr:hypothetical protein [Pseudomonadota bacterium]